MNFLIEYNCPEHGITERFKIKVKTGYNIKPEVIIPKFRTKPSYTLKELIVGRNVGSDVIKDYLQNYFIETGIADRIISIRLI
ncbi:MAG: hypothetical protein QXK49_02195 [Candidatus Aenigmatarchaeota archaeon]